jgi:AraC family transcriptional regulator
MLTISHEAAFAKRFRLERAPTLVALRDAVAPIAITMVESEGPNYQRSLPVPPEEAFAFNVALAPLSFGEIWVNGKYSDKHTAAPGEAFLLDQTTNPIIGLKPPYRFMRFHLPTPTLDQLAYDRGLRRVGGLRAPTMGIQDPVLHGLTTSLEAVMNQPATAITLFLDSIALAFHAHVVHAYGGLLGGGASVQSGLTPWQLRRVHAFVEAHLGDDPSISDFAGECRLSPSHFARAFRRATGIPPHQWLMKRRIERAKEVLLEHKLELAQIALACGFVDQSHLTRTFARHEGHSPGKWRRLRCN